MTKSYLDQWSNVLVLNRALSLELVEAPTVGTVSHGLILEITLASLVANGAVQGVIGKQELHDALTRLVDEGRVGLDNHAGLYRPCARGDWLGSPLHFDQAHSATSSNHQLFVVTVSWDGNSGLVAGLDEGRAGCWGALEPCVQSRGGCAPTSYLRLIPSLHLPRVLAYLAARNGEWHKPIVSSTSAGRRAEALKARLPLRAAWKAGLLSDRIICCRSMVRL
jgi:hypothetical protein